MKVEDLKLKILISLCLLFGFIGVNVNAEENTSNEEVYSGYHADISADEFFEDGSVSFIGEVNDSLQDLDNPHTTRAFIDDLMQIGANGVSGGTIKVYADKNANSNVITYISSTAAYNPDAAILEIDGNWYRIKLAGVDGWIELKKELENVLKPTKFSSETSVTHYKVSENNNLIHNISKGINDKDFSTINNGPAPTYMKQGIKYYSFDGHYFYTNYETMIKDSRAKVSTNAINSGKPHYNYFQFLPMRSETKLSTKQIDDYFTKYRKFTSLIPGNSNKDILPHESNLFGIGLEAKNLGVDLGNNHGTTLGIAINESGWGRSNIAASKNNVFGHSAYDAYPGAAGAYNSVGESFHAHNTSYLNAGYLDATDSRYEGGYVGNKASGINVRYASDSYWGEKAAAQYYTLDNYYNSQDVGNYQFAYKTSSKVSNVSKSPKVSDVIPNMKIRNEHQVFLYLGSYTGESVNGSTEWYRIAVDSVLDKNKNIMSKAESKKDIDYDKHHNVGYVHSSEFKITDKLKNHGDGWTFYPTTQKWAYKDNHGWAYGLKNINGYDYYFDSSGYTTSGLVNVNGNKLLFDKNGTRRHGWYTENGDKYYGNVNSGVAQTGWSNIDGSWYYFNSSGIMQRGWHHINGSWYKLLSDGKMVTGWYQENGTWYYFYSGGSMATGWTKVGAKWYFLNSSGAMAKGWLNLNGTWYYLDSSGSRVNDWNKINNTWYHFDADGIMSKGWLKQGQTWYYLNTSGGRVTGWNLVNNAWYYFLDNGHMTTGWQSIDGSWYYLNAGGRMETGWVLISGSWYYMYGSGKMAFNTTIGNYQLGPNGAML